MAIPINNTGKKDNINTGGNILRGILSRLKAWLSTVSTGNARDGLTGKSIPGLFKFERRIAAGGFGCVYLARNLSGSLVQPHELAVKVFSEGWHSEYVEKEFELQMRANHPNIPRIINAGLSEFPPDGRKRCWISMEFVEGQTLESYMKVTGGELRGKPRRLLEFLMPIFNAVEYIHQYQDLNLRGIVHSDIKPDNILIGTIPCRDRPEHQCQPQPWLVDFGVAKSQWASSNGRTVGTPRGFDPKWAAPEQPIGAQRTQATDVHALGLIMTWGLTGRLPYEADSDDQRANLIQSKVRPTPKNKGFDFGPWETIIAKAVALNPNDRFQTAGTFRDALVAALELKEMQDVIERFEKEWWRPSGTDTNVGLDPAVITKKADEPANQALNKERTLWLVGLPLGVLSVGGITVSYFDLLRRHPGVDQTTTSRRSTPPTFVSSIPSLSKPDLSSMPDLTLAACLPTSMDRDMAVFDLGSIQSASTPPDSIVLDEPGFGPSPVSFGESSGSSSHSAEIALDNRADVNCRVDDQGLLASFIAPLTLSDPALPFAIVPSASTGCAVRRLSDGCCVLMAYRMSLSPRFSLGQPLSTSLPQWSPFPVRPVRYPGDWAMNQLWQADSEVYSLAGRTETVPRETSQPPKKASSNLSKPIGATAEARHSGSPVVIPLADRAPTRPAEHPLEAAIPASSTAPTQTTHSNQRKEPEELLKEGINACDSGKSAEANTILQTLKEAKENFRVAELKAHCGTKLDY